MIEKTLKPTDLLYKVEVELRPVAQLTPYERNARTHSKKQIGQIADSIKTFGFVNPVLIDAGGKIIAGHGRVEAAKQLGLSEVPTITLEHLSESEQRAYILADNRLAELAGWDDGILAIELQYLMDLNLDFDISVIGFETPEIDLLIQSIAPDNDPDDMLPQIDELVPVVSVTGDLWMLGEHRVLCGDALQESSYQQLMGDEKARLIFTDPPYNVPIDGHVCGNGSVKHDEFVMASGELSEAQFTTFLTTTLTHMARVSLPGSLHYVCMDWRHMGELLMAGKSVYEEFKNLCVWNKDNGGMGSFYRSKHELVFVFKQGTAPHVNNIELGRYGRYRTNVWDYPGANSLRDGRMDELRMHPTVKPVALVTDAILDASHRGDLVLDPFGGSGTTILAAERCGRRARVIELSPQYVDLAVRRWQQVTGKKVIHADSGLPFEAIVDQRSLSAKHIEESACCLEEKVDV